MSDTSSSGLPWQQPNSPQAGPQDVVIQLKGIVSQLTALVNAIKNRVTSGTFTLGAAASTVVPQPAVQSLSTITLVPTNASAATLMGSAKAIYVSAIVAGASFTVSTANATNAAGTEQFSYTINTPT